MDFTAGVFFGVGSAFAGADTAFASAGHIGKVVAHGMTGGVMSVLQGGKFGHGFAAAGMAQFAAPGIDGIDQGVKLSSSRVFAAALVGGTTSVMTGGKFGNGAVTGAFSRAFNDELHYKVVDSTPKPSWPTKHEEITSGYDPDRVHPVTGQLKPHRALDIVNPLGDPALAILDGVVADVASSSAAGNYIKVDHANGLQSSYAHTGTSLAVGDIVAQGQVVGTSNGSGIGTGPHLHFSTRINGNRVNPCSILSCPQ